MEDAKVENSVCNVIPVTEYDPFEAKFAASLFWLVFRATEDGEFENIPSQVTSPIQRDSEKRITVRPEVTEFLTKGEIYCQVCNSIFHGKAPVVGQWAVLQTLSRHGFYVVEEGDIAVTDSALQQKKPFRKSTHLALMDCLMNAFSAQAVSVPEVVQCVSKFSSFNASKELPFDLEDALLLWINKISTVLNENQLKKQKHHAEQLLQNQDKAKRFRFRRDQLQPKVQTVFPLMEELLKDISNGKSLLGILMFYHPTVINIEDVRLEKNLATGDCVHNLDLFRSLCSQFICTSVLALKVEDLLYGSQAMKPNVIALLAEVFQKCKVESMSENFVVSKQTSKSDADLRHILANKEDVTDTKCSSAPVLNSDESKYAYGGARGSLKSKIERSSSLSGKLTGSALDAVKQEDSFVKKLQSDGQMNSNSRLSFKSSFHLDFTDDYNGQQPPLNGSLPNQGDEKDNERVKEKENPFTGILQRPVLAGDARKHGSPHTTPRQEVPLLMRRNKQKQRTLDLEDWDMQQGVGVVEELHLNDLQRSQSLTGLDKAKVEPRQSFHAWQEDTVASLSDTNLASSRGERISLDFRPNPTASVPQRSIEGGAPQRGSQGTHVPMKSSKATGEEYTSQDSLLSSPKSTDCLNMKPLGDQLTERWSSLPTGVRDRGVRDRDVRDIDVRYRDVRDSCMSDISTKELKQFEEIEAMILEGRSVETPRRFEKPSKLPYASESQDDDDELNMSVSSEDMNKFRLEVMQRLTEDKLREIPDGPVIEMEDDDDPIMLARNNAASSPGNPTERTRLDAPDMPKEVPTDQLSPITEATEPCPSIASNPNSASNSTAPSSPCSPLDVAPFMPAFFTTSPANTLDRKMQRFSLKDRDNTLVANEDEDEDDGFFGNPEPSATPRFNKSGDCSSRSKSFEQLTRGSYTVGHVPVETAKAAGIPVINASTEETRPRADSNPELNGVLPGGKLSQKETDASQDLSAFRPYVLSSNEDEMGEMFAPEGVDGRRDSLETSPAHSPAPVIIRGKRDDTRPEAVLRSRDLHALDSPGDVVIFERSLSSSHETRENAPTENSKEQGNESAQTHSTSVHRSKKAEAFVFDFDQGVVQNYENNLATQDYGTYKKGKHGSIGDGNTSMKGNQVLNRSQGDHFATFSRNSPRGTQDHRPPSEQQQELAFSREGSVGMKDLRASDGFSTYRKNSLPEKKANDANGVSGTVGRSWDLRRSDGYSTFRKESMPSSAESTLAKYNMAFIQGQRGNDTDPFSTFAKSAQRQESNQHRHQVELNHFPEQESTSAVFRGPTSSREGETEIDTVPRGGDEEPVRSPGASNILRSRTFRKTSSGQIVEDVSIGARSSPLHNELRSSTKNDSKPTGQQTVNTHIRNSSEGTGSDNPHRISWTDDQEAGARLIKQLNASKEMSENNDSGSPRRRGSPRHTGRGSPGARISWLTAARSGVGGQVMLNDKGEIEEPEQNEAEEEQAVTSQIAYLRMQLEEKRRHIEAEKHRAQAEWEDQRRRLGQTAFWYVIGKAQGGPGVGEGTGNEAVRPEKVPVMTPHSHETPRKPVSEFPTQSSPPVAWSSPANSPLPANALESNPPNGAGLETREFRLSDYPPFDNQGTARPSSQPAVKVGSRPTPGPPRPASHEPAASRPSPTRKCWDVNVGLVPTPSPLVHPDAESDAKEDSNNFGGTGEIEVEVHTPQKKGMAMFISDDDNPAPQGLTPEQQRKRERFMKARQKKQAEEKTRKEAELEKKRRREEKQREKEMLLRLEEERLRQEEIEQRKAEQELRLKEAQAHPARIPDSYATYRRPGPQQHVYDVNDDTSTYLATAPSQLSGFAEFSGPQCYVKPSGKSNRKIIVNAISHVCLSGTVNQDQKEKCLQAISENDGHHFMILFKDGLKFRGIYVHNLENDQLFKIFGIGPRVITNKMIESLYKYNSGGKEFTKIPSKTLSISVDGFAIQKSCWNTGKPVVQSKTSSNMKRPPRPPQR
ncbi:calmodulin-regulated spectrin-associated protein 2-like isoform X3 [Stylophora pistillata]|uniref:calmodulin-regulated spectrin-associated protein 2-like isoform X3 n=1 Tax=Stylophora pistillata TaxID=50429 RepID=UPI000C04C1FD|nr:calmodulin-regulated spectrin-associated protein 2-like isoform X3 [Stylophora pistillata]